MVNMEKWFLHTKKADFNEIAEKYNINSVMARIIRNRDVIEYKDIEKFLYGDISYMYEPCLMKDLVKAVNIVILSIKSNKKIRIIGDYDIDGICSTYILYKGLLELGANIDYDIPDRITDGYGLNINMVEKAYSDGIELIVTCDNGIAAYDQIVRAKELKMDIIVTDHHDIPIPEGIEKIPPADAVVDPKQKECKYPLEEICGAVVAYKFIEEMYALMGHERHEAYQFLEFAAIATIGDVMTLQDENRLIVKYGLSLLQNTKNIGLQALIEAVELSNKEISSYHIGFVIGPCLNASGRLESAKLAVELLLMDNKERARVLANKLKELNDKRKEMTAEGLVKALENIEDNNLADDDVLVVYLEDCHESLAGIIAGRIRELYEKPAIVLINVENGVKGSARSIENYNMFNALTNCSDLLSKFGGHPMAAGMSLSHENVDLLRQRLNDNSKLTKDDFIKKIWIDVAMPFSYITEEFIEELSLLEPFGVGNSKPMFAQKNIRVRNAVIIGKNANVLKLTLIAENGMPIEAIMFSRIDDFIQNICDKYGTDSKEAFLKGQLIDMKLDVTYYPSINEYNGNRKIQVIIQGVKVQ
jgi:single-stranded-DNA-specific exonuclease RecJ